MIPMNIFDRDPTLVFTYQNQYFYFSKPGLCISKNFFDNLGKGKEN